MEAHWLKIMFKVHGLPEYLPRCPRCGGMSEFNFKNMIKNKKNGVHVRCNNCGLRTKGCNSMLQAARVWAWRIKNG